MVTPSYTVTCLTKRTLVRDVVEFTLSKPEGFTYKPGQFVLFDVPLVENPSDVQTRAYSIASAPHEKDLLFVAKLIPKGRFSRYLAEKIDTGTEIVMKGPFGFFVPDPLPGTSVVLAATGTGLAPFLSHLRNAAAIRDPRPINLIFGVQEEQDIFWNDEVHAAFAAHGNGRFRVTLSNPPAAWTGLRGWVQEHLPTMITDPATTLLYACGNPLMTKAVKTLAIEQWMIPKKQVHIEGYI